MKRSVMMLLVLASMSVKMNAQWFVGGTGGIGYFGDHFGLEVAPMLIAGPGAITALLSLRADYAVVNILIGLLLNIILDYIVIRYLDKIQKLLGTNLIFIIRKFFGVILLAMAINMFVNNIMVIIHQGV